MMDNKKIFGFLMMVREIPVWDRIPAISDAELDAMLSEACGENHMTVSEYNNEFLPRIDRAREFISLFESSIRHMDDKVVDKNEVYRQFKIRCWSEETKQTILTALEYYQKREGLDKICGSQKKTS